MMPKARAPLVVCVINLKGGVGKSTVTALLARHAVDRRGKSVLAVDLDPQANLSQSLMRHTYNDFLRKKRPSIVEIFNGFLPPSTRSPAPAKLSPNSGIERIYTIGHRSLDLLPSRFDFSDNLISAVRPDPKVLARFLAGNFQDKDLVLIDCAPTESILTQAAYHASSQVLIPVKPEFFATVGFPLLRQSLTGFRSNNRGHRISVAGVVINNAFYHGGNDGGPEKQSAMHDIRTEVARNNWHIFDEEIPFSRGFPKMMRGDYSWPGNAVLFQRFAKEFFDHVGL